MLFRRSTCNDTRSKKDVICSNKILCHFISKKEKTLLIENMNCVRYRKGEMIFYEHQPVQLIYLINSGKVKLWKEGIHKDEQVIYFAKDGDIIGYWGCLENKNYTLSATTLEDTDMCFIKKEIFFETQKTNPEMHFEILQNYTRRLKKIEEYLRNMAEMNIREKVAKALLIFHGIFGTEKNNSTLNIKISRYDIATLIGISIDRAGKQLTEFRDDKIITMEGKKISIDQKALKKIITPYIMLETT